MYLYNVFGLCLVRRALYNLLGCPDPSLSLAKLHEFGIPNNNNLIYIFTKCLANFVTGVGFVTGITFTVHLLVVDPIDCLTFWENQPFSLGCYF